MVDIKIDDETTADALGRAVLAALGQQGQQKIVDACMRYLTTSPGYGGASPLMQLVQSEAHTIAREVIGPILREDAVFQHTVKALYVDAVERVFNVENREKLVEKLATALSKALSEDRY